MFLRNVFSQFFIAKCFKKYLLFNVFRCTCKIRWISIRISKPYPSASAMRKNVAFHFVIIHFHFGFAKKMKNQSKKFAFTIVCGFVWTGPQNVQVHEWMSGARAKSDGLNIRTSKPYHSASATRKNVPFHFVITHFHFVFAKKCKINSLSCT